MLSPKSWQILVDGKNFEINDNKITTIQIEKKDEHIVEWVKDGPTNFKFTNNEKEMNVHIEFHAVDGVHFNLINSYEDMKKYIKADKVKSKPLNKLVITILIIVGIVVIITMLNKIINKNTGLIDCLGYIKEDSNNRGAILENYGTVKLPMVFYDYKGGGCTASLYANNTYKEFPLSQYDFPNIKIEQNHYYGCKMIGLVDLYTGAVAHPVDRVTITMAARHNVDEINFISNEEISLLQFKSEGHIKINYISNSNDYTSYNKYKTLQAGPTANSYFTLNANINFNYFKIALNAANDVSVEPKRLEFLVKPLVKSILSSLNTTMQTKEIDYPIPWNFSISVNSGYSLDFNQRVKFLGGSKLIIKEGATVNINSAFILYDSSNNDKKLYEDVKSPTETIYPYDKGDALLINEGTLNINSGAQFGGKISAISSLGTLNINNGSKLEYTTKEGKGDWAISGWSIKFSFIEYSPNS